MEVTARAERLRRVVHVAVGLPALWLDATTVLPFSAACIAGAAFNVLVLPKIPAFGDVTRVARGAAGTVLYPLTLAVLLLVFRDRPELPKTGWIFLAVGDGLVSAFTWIGGPSWPTRREKRVAPSVAAAAVAFVVAGSAVDWKLAAGGALLAVFADAVPRVDDNVTWPVLGTLGALGAACA